MAVVTLAGQGIASQNTGTGESTRKACETQSNQEKGHVKAKNSLPVFGQGVMVRNTEKGVCVFLIRFYPWTLSGKEENLFHQPFVFLEKSCNKRYNRQH